jgi:hypothetical protein
MGLNLMKSIYYELLNPTESGSLMRVYIATTGFTSGYSR